VFNLPLITLTVTIALNSNSDPNCVPNPYPNTNCNHFKMRMIDLTASHVYRHFV